MRYARAREFRCNPRQPIDLLDPVVQRITTSRFTFTEEKVMEPIWATGEEVRLREDPRFYELEGLGHFHLAEHTLANHLLIDRLWQGLWDGTDVHAELARLDQVQPNCFHVFCPMDPRLLEEDGTYSLTARPNVQLPDDLQTMLDALAEPLLEVHRTMAIPATTLQLRDESLRLSPKLDFAENDLEWLEAWLHHRTEWIEMSRGLWLPIELVPQLDERQVYRVLQVQGGRQMQGATITFIEQETASETEAGRLPSPPPDPPVERHLDASISWVHPLRTIHLNNGYVPVPVAARFRYPKLTGHQSLVAIRGVAHHTGHEGWLWLDRERHCFFGNFLRDIIEWEEAGQKLHLHWQPEAIVIRLGEVDETIRQEEARHIDPQALHDLRLGRGESYRQSLVAILSSHPQGMSFHELYQELSQHQQHSPSRSSIRTILALSPEFLWQAGAWQWRESIGSAKALRQSVMLGATALQSPDRPPGLREVAESATNKVREILARLS